jgi:lipopolysaccharide biosynthesis glycosyltransferase
MRRSLASLSVLPYYICFATDEKYIPYTLVALYSLVKNSGLDFGSGIVVMFDAVSAEKVDNFINTCDKWGVDICALDGYLPDFNSYPVSGHISRVAYARLAIPKIFKGKAKQVLYLDGDVLVRRELRSLLNSSRVAPLYAVTDKGVRDFSYLGEGVTRYLNSGVCVFNLDQITEEIISVPAHHTLRFHDQDVLNIFFKHTWQELPRRYNAMTPDYQRAGKWYLEDEELSNPHIVHFNTYLKPWQYAARHPFRNEYALYWSQVYSKTLRPRWSGVLSFCKTLYHTYLPYKFREWVSALRYHTRT